MERRIFARVNRPDAPGFSGEVQRFSKRSVELRFRVAWNKENEVLSYVNLAAVLNHSDSHRVIAGAQDVGAMSGRRHQRGMDIFNKFRTRDVFCRNGKAHTGGAKALGQSGFSGKL